MCVSFVAFSVNPPYLYMIMEMANQGSLTDVLHQKALNYPQRLEIARDVCRAVAHMHELQFVHRDMKTLNCFVTTDGEDNQFAVRLGDFGETITTSVAKVETPKVVGTTQW